MAGVGKYAFAALLILVVLIMVGAGAAAAVEVTAASPSPTMEILKEEVHDLLDPNSLAATKLDGPGGGKPTLHVKAPIQIQETANGGITLTGVTEVDVTTQEEMAYVLAQGSLCRATGSTYMNNQSRSCHVTATTPSDTASSSSASGTELLSCQNFSNGGSSQMTPLSSSPDGNNGREINDFSSGGDDDDDGDEGNPENKEDHEIKMDLTDDLLHMVFSFLDHSNLCRAAMVCRQWRAASAHEDFWKSLNFENCKITWQQGVNLTKLAIEYEELGVESLPLSMKSLLLRLSSC